MSTPEKPSPDQLPIHRIDQWYLNLNDGHQKRVHGSGVLSCFRRPENVRWGIHAGRSGSSLLLSVLAEMKVAFWVSLAGAACAWGFVERRLRHRKVEQLQGRIKQLETMIDPDRSTSGLTPAGRTNPLDRRK
jgi:hypothetical protein